MRDNKLSETAYRLLPPILSHCPAVPLSHDFPTGSSFNCPLILKDHLDLSGSENHERIERISTIAHCAIYSQGFYAGRDRLRGRRGGEWPDNWN